ncbi:MAG: hypothetical protein KC496_17795, partial [Anaerolineae bacterium]|nr:hypothetical protein [Anaerolineae bacterium]
MRLRNVNGLGDEQVRKQRAQHAVASAQAFLKQRSGALTYSASVQELYGGNGDLLFSLEAERPLMAFNMWGRYHPLLDWLGWESSTAQERTRGYITYIAAAGAAAG